MFFWNSYCFDDPADVGILISGPLPFLNPAWASGSSQFLYVETWLGEFWALFKTTLVAKAWKSLHIIWKMSSVPTVQFSHWVVSDSFDPKNRSKPGHPVHHQLLESPQTHVHRVGDAIHPSHPLLSPSPPTLNLSQHLDLFHRVSSSHQVAKVLEFQLQHQSFQRIFNTDFL